MLKNIILTGFMGVGKTSVGKKLAKDLGYTFVDTDACIEADQRMDITAIFEKHGESYFRDVEARIIKRILEGENQVVSTGGGAVIRDENRALFKKSGMVACLVARPEVIFERIKQETHRPLLQTADPLKTIKDILDGRAQFYRQADLLVDTSEKTVDEAVREIREKVRYARC